MELDLRLLKLQTKDVEKGSPLFSLVRFVVTAVGVLVSIMAVSVGATTYYVNAGYGDDTWLGFSPVVNGSSGPKRTIQAGISASADGDVIIVSEGVYLGPGNRDLDFEGRRITVRSPDPLDAVVVKSTIINCQGEYSQSHRGLRFGSGEDNNSILAGFTITGGYAPSEQVDGESLSLGGAIFCENSSPVITHCNILGNLAINKGGAIFCRQGLPVISNCVIEGNQSAYGGGIYCGIGSYAQITDCQIVDNLGGMYGGGVCLAKESTTTVSNSVIRSNKGFIGGGIYCDITGTNSVIKNCSFVGNQTSAWGARGGIFLTGDCSALSFKQCLITGNQGNEGGGICCYRAFDFTIQNCSISSNKAYQAGSGLLCMNSTGFISNSILWDNLTANGEQIVLNADLDNQSRLAVSNCNVNDGIGSVEKSSNAILDWLEGNIANDPCFARTGQWDQNIWQEGDYHLRSRAGRWDPYFYRSCNLYPDTRINVRDFAILAQVWLTGGQEVAADINRDQMVDIMDLYLFSEQWQNPDENTGRVVFDHVSSPCIDLGDPNSLVAEELWPHGNRINMGAFGGTVEASYSESLADNPVE